MPLRRLLARALPLCVALLLPPAVRAAGEARFLRFPDIHGDSIAFTHAGDLWTVQASGGIARRLTSGEGLEVFPRFSPDGSQIAFTGQIDGSSDVYVIPAEGGVPRRLTWYPSRELNDRMGFDNMVLGWTPEGRVLFRALRNPIGGFIGEPWTVSPEGGPVERFPLDAGGFISFAPDGKRAAITRIFRDFRTWKRYQGGLAQDVWIYDLASKAVEKITDWRGTDTQPMWIGDSIYFLSDREDWKVNLWRYDVGTKAVSRVTAFKEYDCKWAHADQAAGRIVFENGGELWLYDVKAGAAHKVPVQIPDDERAARRHWVGVQDKVTEADLSPDGKRALITARGEVFTVPAENGDTRNLSRTPGAREKNPTWSPDGKWIAFFSDRDGEEELFLTAQDGKSKPVKLPSGPPGWHHGLVWSPDSTRLAWADRSLSLWQISMTEKKAELVTKNQYHEITDYNWSPDSKWLAYAAEVDSEANLVFLYSLESRTSTPVTADGYDSGAPVFDAEGKYLFLLSNRDVAPTLGHLERSYTVNKTTRPYAITLQADQASPFAPKSDEVKVDEGKKEEKKDDKDKKDEKKKEEKKPTRIDLAGIVERVVPFPVSPGNYRDLSAVKGKVLWLSGPTRELTAGPGGDKASLRLFDLEKRKESELLANLDGYAISFDGSKLLYRSDKQVGIIDVKEGQKVGDGALKLDGLKLELDPKAEWAQIFAETWRLYRDFFYLPDMGKVDWAAMRKRYEALLPAVTHRSDLTYLLGEMVAETGTGHAYVGGGEMARPERLPTATLGADLQLDRRAGRWQIARILPSQGWVDGRTSPLRAPGVKVAEGDYLLAVDGQELRGDDEPYRLLVQTAGRTVSLTVNSKPTIEGAHEISVQPVASEWELRYADWVEANRRKVEQRTGGRVGYIHIPDMGARGLTEFIRQYYPQVNKKGLVVDVRANGGGFVSQMILERLRRQVVGMGNQRGERPYTYPAAAFDGPMVALANQYSASDGDIFPYYFRKYGLGPVIGLRTWGGVVGIRGGPGNMIDGGYTNVPEFGIYDVESNWVVENEGVAPDIEVDNLPADVLAGKDAQLERGIDEVLKRLEGAKSHRAPIPASKDLRNPTR